MKAIWLLLKNLAFTALVPGFVAGWVPLRWFERRPRWPEPWGPWQFAGAALIVLGALVYLHCQWLFATRGQGTPAPVDPPRKLVHRGAYRWVRNPMYLAVFALIAGEMVFLRSGHIAVYLTCLACAVHVLVAMFEEEALRRRFGAMYEDYRRDVPRWVPRKPRPPLQTVPPFAAGRPRR
jgi:protein-S-isoprenylcysteine O-methyltransferase Ste14